MSTWRQWRDHPERVWLRNIAFQIHFMIGAIVGVYMFMMSVSGAAIVFQSALFERGLPVERLVDLHANLLAGSTGRVLNGIGAISLTVLCITGAVIWWPGLPHWRRSLTVEWRAHFARINWDVHSAFGFWFFVFVLLWGVSGMYLSLPDQFAAWFQVNPGGDFTAWLAEAHFGRFRWWTEIIWAVAGLVLAILAFTGVFICCRRVIFKKPSNPNIHD